MAAIRSGFLSHGEAMSTSSVDSKSAATDPQQELTPQKLLARASEKTGLSDFGTDFMEPFSRLLDSAIHEVAFTPIGLKSFKADINRMLVNRLRFQADLKQHPEILDEDVADPIVILGLPRTGTTKLQRMMSASPSVQALYFWRLLNPARFPKDPDADPAAPDPRINVAHQAASMLRTMFPKYIAVHSAQADEVDEELLLLAFAFETLLLYVNTPVHGYSHWVAQRRQDRPYAYLGRLIQYLQWQDGGSRGRPWILKSPLHLGNLDVLLDVFPRSSLVHCHRDVSQVVASFCNLIENMWLMRVESVDLRALGRDILGMLSFEMEKYVRLREQIEAAGRIEIYDVSYARIEREPIPIIEEVYRRSGRHLLQADSRAMQAWSERNPKDRFGRNIYSLERYGLSHEQVERAFAGYIERFGQYFSKP